ncbi:MAG: hypothetical protein ACETWQ_12990 [Phycisphaerae bacterium]
MSVDERRRQKKLMKKRKKDQLRKKKRAESVFFGVVSEKKRILAARGLPLYECLINPSWRDQGLANILITRRQPDGNILFGVYLVDVFCLGLKNTFCNTDFPVWKYEADVRDKLYREEEPIECPVSLAYHIIYGAIEFAGRFGFKPNRDFKLSQYILEPLESLEPCEGVEFGKDGKPFYIAGPADNVRHVMRQLESAAGHENSGFLYSPSEFEPFTDD